MKKHVSRIIRKKTILTNTGIICFSLFETRQDQWLSNIWAPFSKNCMIAPLSNITSRSYECIMEPLNFDFDPAWIKPHLLPKLRMYVDPASVTVHTHFKFIKHLRVPLSDVSTWRLRWHDNMLPCTSAHRQKFETQSMRSCRLPKHIYRIVSLRICLKFSNIEL